MITHVCRMETRTLLVNGHAVHVVDGGEGPPLLFLHGWPTHSGLYRNIMPAVAEHRRTIAIDLPGFGRSAKPTNVRYGFSFFNQIIDGVLDQLGIEEVGLVVHDLGGPIGLYWAVTNPSRVAELVVLNTLVFTDFHWMVKVFMASVSLPLVAQGITSSAGLRGSMKFGMQTRPGREVLDLYSERFETSSDRKALAMAGRQLSLRKFADIEKGLRDLHVPTLLMYGTTDRILPDVAQTMTRLEELWPHASKISLTQAGHFLQEDAPDAVADHITRFVRREA